MGILSSKQKVLLLLQYLQELTLKEQTHKGSFIKLAETFEIGANEANQLCVVCIDKEVIIRKGAGINSQYHLSSTFHPTTVQAQRLLDLVYSRRIKYKSNLKLRKVLDSKQIQNRMVFKKEKVMRKGREIKTLKFSLRNALQQIHQKKTLKGGLANFLINWGVNKDEAVAMVPILKRDFVNSHRANRITIYDVKDVPYPNVALAEELLEEVKKIMDDKSEKARLKKESDKRIARNKASGQQEMKLEQNIPTTGSNNYIGHSWEDHSKDSFVLLGDSAKFIIPTFKTIDFVDRYINLMKEVMEPSEITFNTSFKELFDEEIKRKFNLNNVSIEVDLKIYRGLTLFWDDFIDTPIQIK